MNLLVDIAHPCHVHLFKNFIWEMNKKGHQTYMTTRHIFSVIELLEKYNFKYKIIGKKSDSLIKKGFNQFIYDYELLKIFKNENIDIAIGTSINIAHASKFTKTISIVMDDDDDEVQPLMVKFGHPFADIVLSPDVLKNKRRKKDTIYYAGYHELAYLHPKRFTPDFSVLKEAGLNENEKFFILRFNSFRAHHDVGAKGLPISSKRKLVKMLLDIGKVFITTERNVEKEFEKFKITIPPHKIHSFIAFSTLLIGDSQTMTSEAAVLGVPSIRCNTFVGKISYLEEQEKKYDLTYGFTPDQTNKMFEKIEQLINNKNLKQEWQLKRQKMLSEKIDVTAFLVWFVENYPESAEIMRKNPDYQYNFK